MLPEAKSLIEALSRGDDDCKFCNNDNDYDLGEVLEFVSGGKIHKHKLPYDDGTVRELSFYKEKKVKCMKLIKLWSRLGNQTINTLKRQDAIVFVGNDEYEITNIRYKNGVPVGFDATKREWFPLDIKPEQDTWVIVKDKNGKEYKDHQWLGHAWYEFVRSRDGSDGWRADMENIVTWRYQ